MSQIYIHGTCKLCREKKLVHIKWAFCRECLQREIERERRENENQSSTS